MKKIFPHLPRQLPALFFLLLLTELSFAQNCQTRAATKPASFVRSAESYYDLNYHTQKPANWDITRMKARLSKVEGWLKNRLEGFAGAKLDYHNTYTVLDFVSGKDLENANDLLLYKATGLKKQYSGKMMFFAYYCYENRNDIQTEVESGSNVEVSFNNVFAFGFTTGDGGSTVNGKPAFQVIKKNRSEGRIDYYENRSQNNATAKMYTSNDYIILRNSEKPVFIAVTRKEYLEQMLKDVDISATRDAKLFNEVYESNKKMFDLEMKIYKEKDKSYTPEKEAKRRKWFEEDQEKLRKTSSKASPDADAAKEVIVQYLKKPQEWLSKTVKDFYSSSYSKVNVLGFLENLDRVRRNGLDEIEEETAKEIVTINPAYFDKTLSSDVPQVIVIHLQNGRYPHMEKVVSLIKKTAALAPLEAMLNPGKLTSPVAAPTEMVAAHSLKYLPKLKTLTPVVVPAGMKPAVIPVTATSGLINGFGSFAGCG